MLHEIVLYKKSRRLYSRQIGDYVTSDLLLSLVQRGTPLCVTVHPGGQDVTIHSLMRAFVQHPDACSVLSAQELSCLIRRLPHPPVRTTREAA